MAWDASLAHALGHTLLVSAGSGLLATGLAACLVLLLRVVCVPGSRLGTALLGAFLLVPVYVQATAWSSGFGTQGWLRLSQVDASRYPGWGIASVVWIHAVGSLPFCFWILAIGIERIRDAAWEQAWLEGGAMRVLIQELPRRLAPWFGGACLWAFCMSQNDMVVSNLFQVPTLCESVYQQVQFGKVRSDSVGAALLLSAACGFGLAALAWGRKPSGPQGPGGVDRFLPVAAWPGRVRWLGTMAAWGLILVTVMVPLASLAVRIGWTPRDVDGAIVRVWDGRVAMESLQEVATFSDEFRWSLELSVWSAAVATLVAWCLVSCPIPRWLTLAGAVLLGVALAMPGPLVNLAILRLLDWDGSSAWRALGERTLLPPILAVQFRCLPLACGILWLTKRAFETRYGELWRLERAMPWRVRQGIWFRYAATAAITCLLTVFFAAFGELSSYLMVLPPGVTTIAMRMFDLLHYGARNTEASLALVLALLAAGPSLWLSHRLSSMSAA